MNLKSNSEAALGSHSHQGTFAMNPAHREAELLLGERIYCNWDPNTDELTLSAPISSILNTTQVPSPLTMQSLLSSMETSDAQMFSGQLYDTSVAHSIQGCFRLNKENSGLQKICYAFRHGIETGSQPKILVNGIFQIDPSPAEPCYEEAYKKLLRTQGHTFYICEHQTRTYSHIDASIEQLTGIPSHIFKPQDWLLMAEEQILRGEQQGLMLSEATERMDKGEFDSWELDVIIRDQFNRRRVLKDLSVNLLNTDGSIFGSMGTLKEITEETEQAFKLNHFYDRLTNAIDSCRTVCWEYNPKTLEIAVVAGTQPDIISFISEVSANSKALEIVHPDDRMHVEMAFETCLDEGATLKIEFRGSAKELEGRWFRAVGQLIRDQQDLQQRIVGLCWEITEQKKLQQQMLQTLKMESIGTLAKGMAHDFNNMLQIIQGCTELTRHELQTIVPDKEWIHLDRLEATAASASNLTKKLLTFARKRSDDNIYIDLNERIHNVKPIIMGLFGENIHLDLNLCEDACYLQTDRTMIDQILLNLSTNARDAMPEGGSLTITTSVVPKARYKLPELNLDCSKVDLVCLSVEDSGIGMSMETANRAFDPFFTTKDVGKGTGMGLAICHGLVQQCQGIIQVHSEIGKGTRIEIFLPIHHKPVAKTTNPVQYSPIAPATILVVDDQPEILEIAYQALSSQGYTVMTADCGSAALKTVQESGERIDLLLTDVVMPNLSGPMLVERALKIQPHIAVIYMSGNADESTIVKHAQHQNKIKMLQKPFSMKDLRNTVEEHLGTIK